LFAVILACFPDARVEPSHIVLPTWVFRSLPLTIGQTIPVRATAQADIVAVDDCLSPITFVEPPSSSKLSISHMINVQHVGAIVSGAFVSAVDSSTENATFSAPTTSSPTSFLQPKPNTGVIALPSSAARLSPHIDIAGVIKRQYFGAQVRIEFQLHICFGSAGLFASFYYIASNHSIS
jgi:hypothetical protein